mgnify:CR=1 FL=1
MDFGATGKGKDFKKGELIKALQKKYGKDKIKPNMTMGQLKKIMGNKAGNMVLSPKADLDGDGTFSKYERKRGMAIQNAMAKNKKPEGAFIGKLFTQDKIKEMFSRIKGDQAIQDPEAYKKAYNKYATAYGNEPMKDDPKVATADQGKFIVRGMGAAIRGGKTKGSS